jgi:hypothetical protein
MAGNLVRTERFVQDFQQKIRIRQVVEQGGCTGLIEMVMVGPLIYFISVRSRIG